MAIHSALANDHGLVTCGPLGPVKILITPPNGLITRTRAKKSGTPSKAMESGLGTLIWMADREDPERHRFSEDTKKIVQGRGSQSHNSGSARPPWISMKSSAVPKRSELDNPAEVNYKLNTLALQAGYSDQTALEKLIVDQLSFEEAKDIMSIQELMETETEREYLIPDVLPHPSVVLIYGAGGDGKSMSPGHSPSTSQPANPSSSVEITFQCNKAPLFS